MRLLPLLCIAVLVTPAMGHAQAADSSARILAQGKRLYEGRGLCFSCHGKNGEGLLGPTTAIADGKWVHTKGTHTEIVALIKKGIDAATSKSGTVMPARGGSRLTDAEVDAIATYVVTLAQLPRKS